MYRLKNLLFLFAGLMLTVPACSSDSSDSTCEDGEKCDVGDDDTGTVDPPSDDGGLQYERFRNAPAMACVEPKAGKVAQGAYIDGRGRSCIPGILPPNDQLAKSYQKHTDAEGVEKEALSAAERRGLAAWSWFSADGQFLRYGATDVEGKANLLRVLDDSQLSRDERFAQLGVMNDPGCTKATTESDDFKRFGLLIDDCVDPYSSGALGLRLKPNKKFSREEWDALGAAAGGTGADGHYADPEEVFTLKLASGEVEKHGWEVEPPYLPSLTCGACHIQPNPLDPPADINAPKWKNVVFGLGNQYIHEGALLGQYFPKDDFFHQVLMSQQRGTSDTSRVATDNLFNPNMINSVANLLTRPIYVEDMPANNSLGEEIYNPDRVRCSDFRNEDGSVKAGTPKNIGELLGVILKAEEDPTADPRTPDGDCVLTPHILKAGGDSSGPTGALLRVYTNVGACVDEFRRGAGGVFLHPADQRPISRKALHETCSEYKDMEQRVIDTYKYLVYLAPYRLKDAPGGEGHIDSSKLELGRKVFARNCATCHSAAQPDDPNHRVDDPSTWFTDERNAFFEEVTKDPKWLQHDWISDDRRYPVDLLGTNTSRAFATNATEGHIWEEYASGTYRSQGARTIEVTLYLWNPIPFADDIEITFDIDGEAGGRGYYRTPTLTNLWSSAPFLHNNGLGTQVCDGRDADGVPECDPSVDNRMALYMDAAEKLMGLRTRDGKDTIRRTTATTKIMGFIPILKDTSIDTFANLGVVLAPPSGHSNPDAEGLTLLNIIDRIKNKKTATDPIQDKGHTYGNELSDDERRAVIEYMKIF